MNKDERNALINAIILMLYDDDSDALNIMLLQLEQYDVELAAKISKKWLYSLLSDIIGTSERTAYNKLSGASSFTSSELAALKNYFGGNVSIDKIVNYLEILKGKINNEKRNYRALAQNIESR